MTEGCRCADTQEHSGADLALIEPVLERYAGDPGSLIPVLQETQRVYGYLPKDALREIAAARKIPLAKVYGVATFYSQFHLRPRGEKVIRICHGTACHVRGAPEVTRVIVEELGAKVGETTEDRAFTIESVACVGCCGLAPVMIVGEQTHGQLDNVKARTIVATLREEAELARGEIPPSAEEEEPA
ncbi:MAG: NADH-quinone oxidoreductase subunit NuoE [Coriobacteriia bacterium]|nr:NADH-quinone oxidoreductase subunit NuoE [Coriobacteriia bacterium]